MTIVSGLLGGLLYASATAGQPIEAAPRGDVRGLFRSDDYPSMALRHEEQGGVRARLTVGPDGRVTQCEIAESSGSEHLDSATCDVLIARARFEPGVDEAGEPVSGTYVTPTVEWRIRQTSQPGAKRLIDTPFDLTAIHLFRFDKRGQLVDCAFRTGAHNAMSDLSPCSEEARKNALRFGMDLVREPDYAGTLWATWDVIAPEDMIDDLVATSIDPRTMHRSQSYRVRLEGGRVEKCTLIHFTPEGNDYPGLCSYAVPWGCERAEMATAGLCNGEAVYRTMMFRDDSDLSGLAETVARNTE